MQKEIEALEKEFIENQEVKFTLSHEEGKFFLRLIESGNKLKTKNSGLLGRIAHIFKLWRWKYLFNKSFDNHEKANVIFRFYMLYKGSRQLKIFHYTGPDIMQFKIVRRDAAIESKAE